MTRVNLCRASRCLLAALGLALGVVGCGDEDVPSAKHSGHFPKAHARTVGARGAANLVRGRRPSNRLPLRSAKELAVIRGRSG